MSNHVHNMQQFDKSLRSGLLQPRWFSEVNNGYGSATLNYYQRGLYYLTSLGHLLTGDWWWGIFLVCIFALAGSGLSFYFLASQFYSKTASITGALLYMLLPYHLLNLYWRGALAELLGYVLLPLITLFAVRLGRRGRLRHYALFGLFYGLYLMTHMPTGILLTYMLAFFAVVWAAKERDLKVGLRLAVGMTVGILLSATYWLPAALETKDVYEYATDLFPYHRSYITMIIQGDYFTPIVNYMFVLHCLRSSSRLGFYMSSGDEDEEEVNESNDCRQQAPLVDLRHVDSAGNRDALYEHVIFDLHIKGAAKDSACDPGMEMVYDSELLCRCACLRRIRTLARPARLQDRCGLIVLR